MTTIDLYSDKNLGDGIFAMIYFYNIKNHIEENNITINFYCKPEYHVQLLEFKCSDNIVLFDLENKQGTHLWIANTDLSVNLANFEHKNNLDTLLVAFYNNISKLLNIDVTMMNFCYHDSELLERYEKLPEKYHDLDILIINAVALSGQYVLDDDIWGPYIHKLNDKYKIAVTRNIGQRSFASQQLNQENALRSDDFGGSISCTMDDNLTVKDIAAISTRAKIIFSVNTGVITGLYNSYTLNKANKIFVFDVNWKYENSKFQNKEQITDVTFDEINSILNPKHYFFDLDNTLCKTTKSDYENSEPIKSRIDFLNNLKSQGHKITIWTARGATSGIDHTDITVKQLNDWNIKCDNLLLGKPSYDIYYDDKSFNIDSVLPSPEINTPPFSKKTQPTIVEKGWGKEIVIANNDEYCGKILCFNKGKRFSMHYHTKKKETWYVSKGKFLLIWIDLKSGTEYSEYLNVGDVLTNERGEPHQLIALDAGEIFEVSTPHYDDDSYRIRKGD